LDEVVNLLSDGVNDGQAIDSGLHAPIPQRSSNLVILILVHDHRIYLPYFLSGSLTHFFQL
jgi:hypothetical protein